MTGIRVFLFLFFYFSNVISYKPWINLIYSCKIGVIEQSFKKGFRHNTETLNNSYSSTVVTSSTISNSSSDSPDTST